MTGIETRLRSIALSAAGGLFLSACGEKESTEESSAEAAPVNARLAAEVVASEELILELTPTLKKFAPELFSGQCEFTGLTPETNSEVTFEDLAVEERIWSTPRRRSLSRPPSLGDLLTPPGLETEEIGKAEISLVKGRFFRSGRTRFESVIGISSLHSGMARLSMNIAEWSRDPGTGRWQIIDWKQKSLRALRAPAPFFEEVLERVLPDAKTLAAARTSLHQKILVENYFGGNPARNRPGYSDSRFYPDSVNIHPALSVADVDGDGLEDLYVCVRWGKNLLLRNRGDGTFEECATRFGLDVDGRNTVALFADFDNDGDLDLLLGRSLERSLYLVNREGLFAPHPDPVVNAALPWLVTSASAADVNNDGFLDVYLCTYSPLDINQRISGQAVKSAPEWARRFLAPEDAAEVVRRQTEEHSYLAQVGPPNVLLLGRGTHFEVAPSSPGMAGYRNSFHAAWNDYDRDGDQDLYVANDFAPDFFYRNDGSGGFTDITAAAGIDTMGFAMGAAWGDYDGDGYDDLYVSNMFSKAGRRITAQIPGLDRRFAATAGGNFLYRNKGDGTLERMSGGDGMPIPVHLAGWSWGGQFCDFDNDGHLDLYVSSGFYTPPPGLDIGVDL